MFLDHSEILHLFVLEEYWPYIIKGYVLKYLNKS